MLLVMYSDEEKNAVLATHATILHQMRTQNQNYKYKNGQRNMVDWNQVFF